MAAAHRAGAASPRPVGSYPGGGNGVTPPGPNGGPQPVPTRVATRAAAGSRPEPGGYAGPRLPATSRDPRSRDGPPQQRAGPQPPNSVPPNYGAPPDWRPGDHAVRPVVAAHRWARRPPRPQQWPGNGRTPAADGHGDAAVRDAAPPADDGSRQLSTPDLGTRPEHVGRRRAALPGRSRPSPWPTGASRRARPARAEAAVRELLLACGEDPDREGLRDTPARVARAYVEIFAGLYTDPDAVLDKTFDECHQRAGPGHATSRCPAPASTTWCRSTASRTSATSRTSNGRVTGLSQDRPAGRPVRQAPAGAGAADRADRRRAGAQAGPARRDRRDRGRAPVHGDARHPQARRRAPPPRRCAGCSRPRASSRAEALALIRSGAGEPWRADCPGPAAAP